MSDDDEGAAPHADYARMGEQRPVYRGLPKRSWRDAYHFLLTISLVQLSAVMAAGFVAVNVAFACLYLLDPHGLHGARQGNFADAFFFSVQTLGTIGYGGMSPASLYTNLIMTVESFFGLFQLAIATGLLFARVSRPTSRIMFSEKAVISIFNGRPTLIFRAANQRRNLVVEAEVSMSLLRDIKTIEGATIRRFEELTPLRARTPLFFLTWQVMHIIDETSPLYGETMQSLLAQQAEVLVIMRGLDETFVSMIHARGSYTPDEIVWGGQLADIFSVGEEGRRVIDYDQFHKVV